MFPASVVGTTPDAHIWVHPRQILFVRVSTDSTDEHMYFEFDLTDGTSAFRRLTMEEGVLVRTMYHLQGWVDTGAVHVGDSFLLNPAHVSNIFLEDGKIRVYFTRTDRLYITTSQLRTGITPDDAVGHIVDGVNHYLQRTTKQPA